MSKQESQKRIIVPPHAIFTLVLSKLIKGKKPVIKDAKCEFTYNWDFETNMGLAHLISINHSSVDIKLHPLGIAGYMDFMSDMKPTSFVINGQRVIIYRVILDIKLDDNERSAAIMFNEDGSIIEATDNFQSEDLSKFKR